MKSSIIILSLSFFLVACGPSSESIQNAVASTLTALAFQPTETSPYTMTPSQTNTYSPSRTPRPTNKRPATYTPRPTSTPSPAKTTGPSKTPKPSYTPTLTIDPIMATVTAQAAIDLVLKKDHGPGVYLVGIDIAPGIWRNSSTRDDCYWKRADKYGEIIDNYFGFGGGTIYIAPTDFQIELNEECGTWTWLSPP